jgi:hypothetical protein
MALVCLYTTRGAAFVALLVLAVTQHGGWLAWLVAFAAVPSSMDVHRRPLDLADDLPVGELPLRWPWHGCLAVVAAAAGLVDAAAVLTVLYLALPSIAHWGEAGEARHLCMEGREIRGAGRGRPPAKRSPRAMRCDADTRSTHSCWCSLRLPQVSSQRWPTCRGRSTP